MSVSVITNEMLPTTFENCYVVESSSEDSNEMKCGIIECVETKLECNENCQVECNDNCNENELECLKEKIKKQSVLIGEMRRDKIQKEKVDAEIVKLRMFKKSARELENENVNKFDGDLVLKIDKNENSIIYEKETNKVICANQKFIKEINYEDLEKISIRSIEYCEDGTIMRLYNYKGKWTTATTKCINGKDAYWSSQKSFDEMFWEIMDTLHLEKLDEKYTYIFVLIHMENRLIVPHNENKLVYLSKVNNETLVETESNLTQYKEFDFVSYPEVIENFDVKAYENGWYTDPTKRGIIIKSENGDLYKLDFEIYKQIKEIRGNTPNIMYRFIELLGNPEMLYILELNYPEFKFSFDVVKHSLNKIVRDIYILYVESHIKKNIRITENDIYFKTLKQLHGQYKKTNTPINMNDVRCKVFSLDKKIIRQFLGWFK